MEWLVGKVECGATGCGYIMSFLLSKQHTLCRMTYCIEGHVFIVKTFYHTSSFVTVQRQFQRNFNRWQAPARSAASHLVVSMTTRKVWWKCTDQHTCRTMLLVYAKHCFWVWENLRHDTSSHSVSKEHQHTPRSNEIWWCILTISKLYRCPLKLTSSGEMSSVRTYYSLCSSALPPYTACALVMKPTSTSVG